MCARFLAATFCCALGCLPVVGADSSGTAASELVVYLTARATAPTLPFARREAESLMQSAGYAVEWRASRDPQTNAASLVMVDFAGDCAAPSTPLAPRILRRVRPQPGDHRRPGRRRSPLHPHRLRSPPRHPRLRSTAKPPPAAPSSRTRHGPPSSPMSCIMPSPAPATMPPRYRQTLLHRRRPALRALRVRSRRAEPPAPVGPRHHVGGRRWRPRPPVERAFSSPCGAANLGRSRPSGRLDPLESGSARLLKGLPTLSQLPIRAKQAALGNSAFVGGRYATASY